MAHITPLAINLRAAEERAIDDACTIANVQDSSIEDGSTVVSTRFASLGAYALAVFDMACAANKAIDAKNIAHCNKPLATHVMADLYLRASRGIHSHAAPDPVELASRTIMERCVGISDKDFEMIRSRIALRCLSRMPLYNRLSHAIQSTHALASLAQGEPRKMYPVKRIIHGEELLRFNNTAKPTSLGFVFDYAPAELGPLSIVAASSSLGLHMDAYGDSWKVHQNAQTDEMALVCDLFTARRIVRSSLFAAIDKDVEKSGSCNPAAFLHAIFSGTCTMTDERTPQQNVLEIEAIRACRKICYPSATPSYVQQEDVPSCDGVAETIRSCHTWLHAILYQEGTLRASTRRDSDEVEMLVPVPLTSVGTIFYSPAQWCIDVTDIDEFQTACDDMSKDCYHLYSALSDVSNISELVVLGTGAVKSIIRLEGSSATVVREDSSEQKTAHEILIAIFSEEHIRMATKTYLLSKLFPEPQAAAYFVSSSPLPSTIIATPQQARSAAGFDICAQMLSGTSKRSAHDRPAASPTSLLNPSHTTKYDMRKMDSAAAFKLRLTLRNSDEAASRVWQLMWWLANAGDAAERTGTRGVPSMSSHGKIFEPRNTTNLVAFLVPTTPGNAIACYPGMAFALRPSRCLVPPRGLDDSRILVQDLPTYVGSAMVPMFATLEYLVAMVLAYDAKESTFGTIREDWLKLAGTPTPTPTTSVRTKRKRSTAEDEEASIDSARAVAVQGLTSLYARLNHGATMDGIEMNTTRNMLRIITRQEFVASGPERVATMSF